MRFRQVLLLLLVVLAGCGLGDGGRTLATRPGHADTATEREPAALALAEGDPAEDPDSPAGDAVASPLSDAAQEVVAFDQFILQTFAQLVDTDELYGAQVLVSMHCNDMIGDTGVDGAFGEEVRDVIRSLGPDDCDDIVRSPLFVTTPSPDADTWSEVTAARFERAVSWNGHASFEERAREACIREETVDSLMLDQRLSRSEVVELASLVSEGDCELLGGAESELLYGQQLRTAFGDRLDELTDEQIRCIDRTADEFATPGNEPPASVVVQFGRPCAEDWFIDNWASIDQGPHVINLPTWDERRCFAQVVTSVANMNFDESLQWFTFDRMDPPSDERAQIEVFLSMSCGLDRFEAIDAGLSDTGSLDSAQQRLDPDDIDNTTFYGVVNQIRFAPPWIVHFSGGATLREEVESMDERDRILLTLPIRAADQTPTPAMIEELWETSSAVMEEAGYTHQTDHECVKDDATAVKIFTRTDGVTGDALLVWYPDGSTPLFVTVLHPERDDGYIDRALNNWCL